VAKVRNHNEWFRPSFLKTVWEERTREDGTTYQAIAGYESSRKSCPTCKAQLSNILTVGGGELDGYVWSWLEYLNAKPHLVKYFCRACFKEQVQRPLLLHAKGCRCEVTLCGKGVSLPSWITLNQETICGAPSQEATVDPTGAVQSED